MSAPGEEVLAFRFAAADRYGCGLRVLHTWALPAFYGADMGAALQLMWAEVAQDARRALDEALAPWTEKYPGVSVVRECRQGRPAQDLVDASRGPGWSWWVAGTGVRGSARTSGPSSTTPWLASRSCRTTD
ncbi:hypothetical protein [Streptomyces sp. NPDC090021]|uniref:hypothetical protein n=1 Tax=Streptomyces sp. NPDC090021 TaxID=3365919 RepID=UPI0037FC6CE0